MIAHRPSSANGTPVSGMAGHTGLVQSLRVATVRFLMLGISLLALVARAQTAGVTNGPSRLVELAGHIELARAGQTNWQAARVGLPLNPGDRLRTGPDSRATLRLSDKSVIRLDQNTVLELQPPRQPAALSRFRLRLGSLFFFDRERPADIEFETPLATGAIRGTEFLLSAAGTDAVTTLALYDGAVELSAPGGTWSLTGGQQAVLAPGRPAVVTAALPLTGLIQWVFYYPGVLSPGDFDFTAAELATLARSLAAYRDGDLLQALAELPKTETTPSDSVRAYRAALKLAVGQVGAAEALLAPLPATSPAKAALRELIAAVRLEENPSPAPTLASGWLAHSYFLQTRSRLAEALAAARQATGLAPEFGFAWVRVAELEFSFGRRRAARAALATARRLSPRQAQAFALEGFLALDEREATAALRWFDQALALDAALGNAWLGRALAQEQLGRAGQGRRDLQVAAALEPQRSLFRSYLGRAFATSGEDALADRDFRLAQQLDPGDPTPWLDSALHQEQLNRSNDAIRELERSVELNDHRSLFRSRLLLDGDYAVRSADLAAIYDGVGFDEVSRQSAARAVESAYADFAGHLFLARSLQTREDPNRFDLRFETPRQGELLVANLLAPAGGGNLSQLLSQQDHLYYFAPRPFGASSLTEYRSGGDWEQAATLFGTVGGFSYAVDSEYLAHHGWHVNGDSEQTRFLATIRQQLSVTDSVYFQAGYLDGETGDVAQHYDPGTVKAGLRARETQEPHLYAGWHHEWSPGSHTLLLAARLEDRLSLTDPQANVLFLRQSGGQVVGAGLDPFFALHSRSTFTLDSVEVQQLWQAERHAVIAGARYQAGSVDTSATLARSLSGVLSDQSVAPGLERANGYLLYQWHPWGPLRLTGGVGYDHLAFPLNSDLPPLSTGEQNRSLVSPRAALSYAPWSGGNLRAAYSQSLGGLYFDDSVRLEPTQLAGFTTAFRSLIPESAAGIVPGTRFETWGVGFDQRFVTDTYVGVEGESLESDGEREAGAFTNSSPLPFPDTLTHTRQTLGFHERAVSGYANQLVGENWAFGARYRLSVAELTGRFPELPTGAPGVSELAQDERAVLGHLNLFAVFHHGSGFFARWDSDFFAQSNSGYTPDRPGDRFWQHNVWLGWRFPHHHAELRVGVLNLAGQDYRLNPLNLVSEPPRSRTFAASVKLNF